MYMTSLEDIISFTLQKMELAYEFPCKGKIMV